MDKIAESIYGYGAPEAIDNPQLFDGFKGGKDALPNKMVSAGGAALRDQLKGSAGFFKGLANAAGNVIYTRGAVGDTVPGANTIAKNIQSNRDELRSVLSNNPDIHQRYVNDYTDRILKDTLKTPGYYKSPLMMYASMPVLNDGVTNIPNSMKPGYRPDPSAIKPAPMYAYGRSYYPSIVQAISNKDGVVRMRELNTAIKDGGQQGYIRDAHNNGYINAINNIHQGTYNFLDKTIPGEYDDGIISPSVQQRINHGIGTAVSAAPLASLAYKGMKGFRKGTIQYTDDILRSLGFAPKAAGGVVRPVIGASVRGSSIANIGNVALDGADSLLGIRQQNLTGIDYNPTAEKAYNIGKNVLQPMAKYNPMMFPYYNMTGNVTRFLKSNLIGDHPAVTLNTLNNVAPAVKGVPDVPKTFSLDYIKYPIAYHSRYTPMITDPANPFTDKNDMNKYLYNFILNNSGIKVPNK